ncbi:MAG: hypothetical protein Ta2F_07090 [Termitinemataceae bacterium]|nr:MAG: hypothetical protein Ta2F_07090 [Termitinemataceae bacterium]
MAQEEFMTLLKNAIDSRQTWFERTELPKLKEEFRTFHSAVSSLYSLFVQKGQISEDPYKNDMKLNDINVPTETSAIADNNLRDQLGLRISALDNQLDFLCNFYEYTIPSFSQNKIKTMLGIIRYIDWQRLTPESQSFTTRAFAQVLTDARRAVVGEPISAKLLTDSIHALEKGTKTILAALKQISDFNREIYKYDLRLSVVSNMSAADINLANIKKRMTAEMPSVAFYQELVEEILHEDVSKDSASVREKLLKKLNVSGEKKVTKGPVTFKPILIDGLNAIGGSYTTLQEISEKVGQNHELLSSLKKGFFVKIRRLIAQMTNKEDEPVVYDLEYSDPVKGAPVKEKVNYKTFSIELEKRISILAALAANGTAAKKLLGMEEKQLIEILQQNIKTVQKLHSTLSGLDEYFKKEVDKKDRSRIKGYKPELSALKGAQTKGHEKLQEYNSLKEEDEQFKRLGIDA